MSLPYGQVVEQANLAAAIRGGQPDFTYRPVLVAKGGARREVSDGFVWVGDRLALTSAKARDPARWVTDSENRQRQWLDKHILRAADQIDGSWRYMLTASDLIVVNERGHEVPWSPDRVNADRVVGVVIVDCPSPAGYQPPKLDGRVPMLAVTRQDWELVNRTIFTATGVIGYLRLRAGLQWSVPLGGERDALATVVRAERQGDEPARAEMEPRAWDRLLADEPDLTFGTRPDDRYGLVIDSILADVGDEDPEYTTATDPHDHLRIAAFLDAIPRLDRVIAGKRIMEKSRLAYEQNRERYMVLDTPTGPLLFISDPADRRDRVQHLQQLALAFHTRLLDDGADPNMATVGVATEPYPNDGRSHDFIYMQGGFRLTDEERRDRDSWLDSRVAVPRPIDEGVLARLHDP